MIRNPLKTWWKARYWFRLPKLRFHFRSRELYMSGWLVRPNKWFSFEAYDLRWKDKYSTPRHEYDPYIKLRLFKKFVIMVTLSAPDKDRRSDDYWEQILWTIYYAGKDPVVAKATWPWKDSDDNSTWKDEYLTKIARSEIFNYCMRANKIKQYNEKSAKWE